MMEPHPSGQSTITSAFLHVIPKPGGFTAEGLPWQASPAARLSQCRAGLLCSHIWKQLAMDNLSVATERQKSCKQHSSWWWVRRRGKPTPVALRAGTMVPGQGSGGREAATQRWAVGCSPTGRCSTPAQTRVQVQGL